MADEERERTSDCEVGKDLKGKEVNNGDVIEVENGVGLEGNSAGSSGDCVRTYARRKRLKMSSSSEEKSFDAGKVYTNLASQRMDKASGLFAFLQAIKEPENMCLPSSSCNRVNLVRMDSHASANGSEYCSAKDWRKVALKQMYQSLNNTEGGLQECIRDALSFHPEGGCTNKIKESVQLGEEMHNGTQNGSQNASKKHVGVMSNGSTNKSVVHTNTDQCKHVLLDVLISTKFSELCDLLFEHFQGLKVDKLFDINMINTRIKEGVYESSPMLFLSDIQKVWAKLQRVGTEMVSLAKSLSEQSRASCHDQVLVQEFNAHPEVEQIERPHRYRISTCRQCSEKTDGRECLLCDYCKEIYHVSCIGPDVQDIPLKSWCCLNCRVKGIASPHENCVLCKCLKARKFSQPLINEEELEQEESTDDLEQNGLEIGEETLRRCNMCKNELENEAVRVCGHPFCSNKYYHERCLSFKQLNTYGSCWYCPSCLCRRCLTDRDDDKIVLCDGCDKAFHIYCMQPPLTSIPKGKWFCIKCDQGLQRLHKVKMAYPDRQYKLLKKAEREKITYENVKNIPKEMGEDLLDKSGGVDMLLTAAKTLNYEENLAAQGFN